MASIWRAADEATGDVVAIKRLHPHLLADADARERLRREAAAMGLVHHPNLVRIRGVIEDDDPALVMDFVEGSSLGELIAQRRRFTQPEGLAIAAAAADGLAAAHAHGIVHRDVKPANILVGDDGVVRVFDFGVAVALDDATALTADGDVIGTLRYLPPERLDGHPATPASDVWGLGAVLYELLAGRPAFPARTLSERIERAPAGVRRPKGIDDEVWAVLRRCLETDPLDRYPTGESLAAALHDLPGVPEPADDASDPLALTEVIALPEVEDDVIGVPARPIAPLSSQRGPLLPIPTPRVAWPLKLSPVSDGSRAVWMAGTLAAVPIALVVVAGAGGSGAGKRPGAAGSQATELAVPTALPVGAKPKPTPTAEKPSPAHDVKRKGKGHRKP
jgi:serine/threonine-protein kinase